MSGHGIQRLAQQLIEDHLVLAHGKPQPGQIRVRQAIIACDRKLAEQIGPDLVAQGGIRPHRRIGLTQGYRHQGRYRALGNHQLDIRVQFRQQAFGEKAARHSNPQAAFQRE